MESTVSPRPPTGSISQLRRPSSLQHARKRWSRPRRLGVALLVGLTLLAAGGGVLKVYGNEILPPLVDAARAVFGAEAVAQFEADVYGLAEQWRQVQRDWGVAPKVAAPWEVTTPPPGGPADPGDGGNEALLPAPVATIATEAPPTGTPTAVAPPATATATATITDTPEPLGLPQRSWSAPRPTDTETPTAAPTHTPRPRRPTHTPTPTELPTADAYPNGADPSTGEVPYLPETPSLTPTPTDTATPEPTATDTPVPRPPTRAPAPPAPAAPTRAPAPPYVPPAGGHAPAPVAPLIRDGALPGEGVWVSDGLPAPPDGGPPAFWKTFLRPNPARPDAMVYLVRFDPRRLTMHMVAGTQEPQSASPVPRTGMINPSDLPNLAAAFNGGWKSVHGDYGMQVDGTLIAPAKPNAMTLVQSWSGHLLLGPWNRVGGGDLQSFRQNCPPMIDNGQIRVSGHTTSTWGLSLLNEMYVWRSGLGQTPDGALIYAAGTPLSVDELALALQRAGATEAMQLDINSAWVRWVSYAPDGKGGVRAGGLVPAMYVPATQYLRPVDRDFFYLTWK